MERDPRIDEKIAKAAPLAQPILRHLRELVHRTIPEAGEAIKWGMPHFTYKGKNIAGMASFKAHCAFMIHGEGRQGEREGMGSFSKIVSLADLPPEAELIEKLRADLNDNRGSRPKLTLLPLLIVAICRALPKFPMLNARYDDEANLVTRHGAVHMGMATMTDAGLMVPVIRDAQAKNLWQLAAEILRLSEAARNATAKSEELSGSTFTITSLGPLGGIASTPVINKPEVAILAPNRIVERPMFVADGMGGERVAKRKTMNLSISCDHRVVDGYDAAAFVQEVKRLIETPVLLLAD